MSLFKRAVSATLATGDALSKMSKAQADWELNVSKVILGRRKKFLFAALIPVIIGIGTELAYAGSGSMPATIGGSKAYLPGIVSTSMFIGSIFLGLMAGLITGVIGAGGGYVTTPAMMSIGVSGIMAVGTDQFHLFAKGIMGTVIHKKLGNVNFWIAVWFVIGSVFGASCGGVLNRAIYAKNPALSDVFISLVYAVILFILGVYAVWDFLSARKKASQGVDPTALTSFAKWIQRVPLKPRVSFDRDLTEGGRSLCVYPLIIIGFIVGMLAAIMGVGGGFVTFPVFVYGLGISTFTTVGTDILQIIFTTGYSSITQYAVYGYVFYSVALGMLLGSLVGVQIGAMVTKMVKGVAIRAFYGLTILAGFVNRICALPGKLNDANYIKVDKATSTIINNVGIYVFFILMGIFSVWILYSFFKGIHSVREAALEQTTVSTEH